MTTAWAGGGGYYGITIQGLGWYNILVILVVQAPILKV